MPLYNRYGKSHLFATDLLSRRDLTSHTFITRWLYNVRETARGRDGNLALSGRIALLKDRVIQER